MRNFFLLLSFTLCLANITSVFGCGGLDCRSYDYIKEWGRLKLVDKQLCSENGDHIQLQGCGASINQLTNSDECTAEEHIAQMKLWCFNVYRGAMYINEEGGYNDDKDGAIQTTKDLIDLTAKYGMYYLCDWHMSTPGNPNDDSYSGSSLYFDEISSYVKSKGYKHVLYEICNEPNGCSWDDIKTYADKVIPVIQPNDPSAIIIVGTPQWCQQIGQAANSPITGYSEMNLLYSFHLYAGDLQHMSLIQSQLIPAMGSIPVFISEWGSSAASGGGSGINNYDSNIFLNYLYEINNRIADISWCYWGWGHDDENAMFMNSCDFVNLNAAGNYLMSVLSPDIYLPIGSQDYEKLGYPYPPHMQIFDKNYSDLFNVGHFDVGGEGIAYHEENSSIEENTGKPNGNACNAGTFRYDECVDVSTFTINEEDSSFYIDFVEPGEWLDYTIVVKDAGYYKISAASTTNTADNWGLGISIVNSIRPYLNGNIIRRLDALDQNDDNNVVKSISFIPATSDECSGEPEECWAWKDVKAGPGYGSSTEIALLFKKPGVHTVRLFAAPELVGEDNNDIECGHFGSFKLEYVEDLTIHDSEFLRETADAEFTVANESEVREKFIVTPSTDNKEYAKYSRIFNMMGVEVSNTNLTPGIYFGIK